MIDPDLLQPRRSFDERMLKEVAASIQARDIVQRHTVRWEPSVQKYRIIDGERRYRAAAIAKLRDMSCLLAEADSRDVLVDQIVHNWQPADLWPHETAHALVRLKSEFGMTPAQIAKLTGKSMGDVAKLIALIERVVPEVQERVRGIGETSLTKRHLNTLSQLAPDQQRRLAARIERKQLTVLETERLVRAVLEPAKRQQTHSVGWLRKHIRIPIEYGIVQLAPAEPKFTGETLLAMLQEACRKLSGAEFPEK